MEKLSLSSKNTWAKLIGTVVSISGAFVVTFYKGPLIIDASPSPSSLHQIFDSTRSDWILGSLFLTMGYIFSVTWCIYLVMPYSINIFLYGFHIFLEILI